MQPKKALAPPRSRQHWPKPPPPPPASFSTLCHRRPLLHPPHREVTSTLSATRTKDSVKKARRRDRRPEKLPPRENAAQFRTSRTREPPPKKDRPSSFPPPLLVNGEILNEWTVMGRAPRDSVGGGNYRLRRLFIIFRGMSKCTVNQHSGEIKLQRRVCLNGLSPHPDYCTGTRGGISSTEQQQTSANCYR